MSIEMQGGRLCLTVVRQQSLEGESRSIIHPCEDVIYFGAYNRLDGRELYAIRRYHFPMSQTGAWEIEGDRYTYTGPCDLELELVCHGTSMWLPQPHAHLEVSFTLPLREPPVAPEAQDTTSRRTAEAEPSTRKRTWQDYLDAPAYRRAVRRSMPPGTTGRRTLPNPPSSSSELMKDESNEIEAEADADEDGVLELVNIKSSIEMDRSIGIQSYHFSMSQEGAWEIEGDRYTYIGPCGLELELVCRGTSMWLPQHHAYLEASFTLPPMEPTPVAPEAHYVTFRRTAEAGPSTRKRTWQDCLDAPTYKRAVRRSMPPGTTGRRTLPDPPSFSSEPMEDESIEIEAEADADEDGVIELVNIESSLEVIELSSDSGTEEDPSECSSTPSSAISSR
ncbi:hypothetical protein Lal_00021975 [Lupinus albus]|nr:hypothetical protein Lal_00021975 [Lupinus albus]